MQILCPKCEEKIRLDSAQTGDILVCPNCKAKFRSRKAPPTSDPGVKPVKLPRPIRADDVPRPVPRQPRPIEEADEEGPPEDPGPRPRPRRRWKRWKVAWCITLLTVVPLGLLFLALAPFGREAAAGAIVLGLFVFLVALIRMYIIFKRKGLVDANETAPWYLRGGLLTLLSQISYTWQLPKTLGVWLFLEIFGLIVMLTGAVIAGAVKPPSFFDSGTQAVAANHPVAQAPRPRPQKPDPNPKAAPEPVNVPHITGDETIDTLLADLADEKEPGKRGRAAGQFAKMQANEQHRAVVAQRLMEVATAPLTNAGVRESLRALAVWATPNEVLALVGCFRESILRRDAGKALRTVGVAAETDVLALVSDKDRGIQREAIAILKDIGTERSVPTLQAVVDSRNVFVSADAETSRASIHTRTYA